MNHQIELLKSVELHYFPSGSSINYCNEKLFLIGDDANDILVLNRDYQQVDSIPLFNFSEKRIPKPLKSDLEASTFITIKDQDYLLILGSAATKQRERVIVIPFLQTGLSMLQSRTINNEVFMHRLKSKGIDEVNIEGATVVENYLVMSNRGNKKKSTNHFIITEVDFWERQAEASLSVVSIEMPPACHDHPGVSEVCYVETKDMLLITFSSELTDNAYDDGAIGNSYMGWVYNMKQKIQQHSLVVDQIVNLTEVHSDFENEKIEGICVESVLDNTLILHLISDNDQGESKLFNVKMTIHE
jgi:hypothetical protein